MSTSQAQFAKAIASLTERKEQFVVATVVQTEGSSLAKPGFKVVISKDGKAVWGSLGGACPESAIVSASKRVMQTGTPRVVKVYLEDTENAVEGVLRSQNEDEIHVETNCGGSMDIYIEPYQPKQGLVPVGHGRKDEV